MTYHQELDGRIRQLIGSDPELTEKKMFGGLAFLVRGNMAIAREGGAMVRVDPAQSDALVATTKATPMNMRGRDMPGRLRVSADDLRSDDQLAPRSRSARDMSARYRPRPSSSYDSFCAVSLTAAGVPPAGWGPSSCWPAGGNGMVKVSGPAAPGSGRRG